jgi:UDP-N-acetylmuramoyl-L-alanyl-D-glutamate--2,6-diaminopimelate ligase
LDYNSVQRQGDSLRLYDIIRDFEYELVKGDLDIEISKIEHDSRKVSEGDMFIAIKGFSVDGHNYVNEAIDKGASCIVVEKEADYDIGKNVTLIKVQDTLLDHLDYHKTMENYYKSKLKLFNMTERCNVINADDEYGRRMLNDIQNNVPIITYGINEKYHVYATDVNYHTNGVDFILNTPKGNIPINMKLLGMFNVYNALAAASCAISYDISLPVIKKGIESVTGIKGRFEVIHVDSRDFDVIIDYAHTPDGLEKVLQAINGFAKGRKIVVFGAGGNRDREKRPIMGEIAAKYADICIVTSDNPRYEDPEKIIEDILAGVRKGKAEYVAITDRKDAIKYALEIAKPKDTILLAGKGHETYIIIKDKVIPFDEKQIVTNLING